MCSELEVRKNKVVVRAKIRKAIVQAAVWRDAFADASADASEYSNDGSPNGTNKSLNGILEQLSTVRREQLVHGGPCRGNRSQNGCFYVSF